MQYDYDHDDPFVYYRYRRTTNVGNLKLVFGYHIPIDAILFKGPQHRTTGRYYKERYNLEHYT
jgi:hypothetical protein